MLRYQLAGYDNQASFCDEVSDSVSAETKSDSADLGDGIPAIKRLASFFRLALDTVRQVATCAVLARADAESAAAEGR